MYWGKSVAAFLLFCAQIFGQVRLSTEAADRLLIEKVDPVESSPYWPDGTARFDITVSESGTVVAARKIHGSALLIPKGRETAMKRRYRPYLLGGRPVSFITTVDIAFVLSAAGKDEAEETRKIEAQELVCAGLMFSDPASWNQRCAYRFSAFDRAGYGMYAMGQYQQVLDHYSKLGSNLQQRDDLGFFAYKNLGHAYLGRGQFDVACEFFRKAEKSFPAAYDKVENSAVKRRYRGFLSEALRAHLEAAHKAGAVAEAAEIKNRLDKQP